MTQFINQDLTYTAYGLKQGLIQSDNINRDYAVTLEWNIFEEVYEVAIKHRRNQSKTRLHVCEDYELAQKLFINDKGKQLDMKI